MNRKKKIILLAFVIVICIVCIFIITLKKSHENNIDPSISYELENTDIKIIQKIEGLEFSNVEIEDLLNGSCELRANVKNTTGEMIESQKVKIIVSNEDNLYEIFGGQISSIMAGKETKLNAKIRQDITTATKVEFLISN